MKIHITNLYGTWGTHALAQRNVTKIARELGFTEMGLYQYPVECDSKEELRKRLDGITSAVEEGDIVIFQSPTWNAASYDRALVNNIRTRKNIRLAIFIHDVITMMFEGAPEKNLLEFIQIYNMADLVIVPSERMLAFLQEKGLTVKKTLVQSMWDLPFTGEVKTPEFRRQVFFSGSPNRFKSITFWNQDVPVCWFTNKEFEIGKNGKNILPSGWKNTVELLTAYTEGGFGLVWEQTDRSEYYKYNQPHKLSTYLAAGIPVIMQKGLVHEQTVSEQGLGFIVDSFEEAADIVTNISEEEYYQLVNNIKNISFLVRGGFFTKKLLLDTVNYLLLGL